MRVIKMANGRTVGKAVGSRAVFKVGPECIFRKVGFYSLDAGAVSDAARDCDTIVLVEDSGKVWSIPLTYFMANAKRLNFGLGIKLVVSKAHYQRDGAEQLALIAVPPPQSQPSTAHYGAGA